MENHEPTFPTGSPTPETPAASRFALKRSTLIGCAVVIVACLACGGLVNAMTGGGGSSATPTATPTATTKASVKPAATIPVVPTPTIDPQVQYVLAYKKVVVSHSGAIAQDMTGNNGCDSGDIATCRDTLVTLDNDVKSFQSDLKKVTVPTCLVKADANLRAALGLYQQGAESAIQGIDDYNNGDQQTGISEVNTGTALIKQGTKSLNTATDAVNTATCPTA